MASTDVTRCKRCATKMRNARKICPSCGLDLNEPLPVLVEAPKEPAPGERRIKPVRPTNKLCPVCMGSFPEAEFVESQGKMLCGPCAEIMAKKGGGATSGASVPSAAAASSAPASSPATAPNNGLDPASLRWQEEALGKRLKTSKIIMGVCGVLNLLIGAVLFFAVTAGSHIGDKLDSMMDDEANQKLLRAEIAEEMEHQTGRKPSSSEVDFKMSELKIQQDKGREMMSSGIFKAKLLALFTVGVGILMIGLLIFMNTYPFECSLAALIIYAILRGIAIFDGDVGIIGIAVTISILGSMVAGVQAGHAIKQLRAKAGKA